MIGKLENRVFLIFIMIFYVNMSSIFSMSIERKITLSSPSDKDLFEKTNANNFNNNFVLINEKLDTFNKFLDDIVNLNLYNFFEKSVEKELTKSKKIYFEKNNLDSSILTQIKSNETNSNDTDTSNEVKKEQEKPIENAADNITANGLDVKEENKDKNVTEASTPSESEEKAKEDSPKTSDNPPVVSKEEKKELNKELEESKSELDKIKYGNDDLKDKTNKIVDKIKDLDEKQTKLIYELGVSLKESNEQSNKNIDSVKEKTDKLERELELQKQNAIDIRSLFDQSENLSKRIDNADLKTREISESLSSLTNDFRNVKFKIISDKIDSDNKMIVINKKLSQQLKLMYTNQILESQKQAEEIQNKLSEDNIKVKQIKSRLPETDNICSLFTNCASCTSNPNCGWCSMSQECVPGSKNGPSNGQCTLFDYGSCGGPRECSSYSNCGDCLKDISCGWCNSPGKQKCMEKNLAEQGNCSQDVFIHLWKSLNICPHDKNQNKEASFNSLEPSVLDSLKQKDNTEIPLIDPLMKKRLIEELKFYLKEISQNELKLGNILSAVGDLKKELLKLEKNPDITDEYAGISKKAEKTEEEINKEFKNITEMLLPILQDYLKKASEKEAILKSGDDLLKEIREKEINKAIVTESDKDKSKDTELEANYNSTKIEGSNNFTEQQENESMIIDKVVISKENLNEITGNSTVLESGLINNNSEIKTSSNDTANQLLPLTNSSITSNVTSDNLNSNSTISIETNGFNNNTADITSNVLEKTLDHITVSPSESNKTINDSNNSTNTNQTTEIVEENNKSNLTDNNSIIINSSNYTDSNSTILSNNHASFMEMNANKPKDIKSNLRAKASIII